MTRDTCADCCVTLHRNGPNAVIDGDGLCETCGDERLRAAA